MHAGRCHSRRSARRSEAGRRRVSGRDHPLPRCGEMWRSTDMRRADTRRHHARWRSPHGSGVWDRGPATPMATPAGRAASPVFWSCGALEQHQGGQQQHNRCDHGSGHWRGPRTTPRHDNALPRTGVRSRGPGGRAITDPPSGSRTSTSQRPRR
jgi:hypothetical protein